MPARSMRDAHLMFASSSKRALSSSTTATCLPFCAARTRCLMTSRVLRRPVQRHLDRAHLRIVRRLAQEPLDRLLERLVRVMHEQVLRVADRVEDVAVGQEVDRLAPARAAGRAARGCRASRSPSGRAGRACRRPRTRRLARRGRARRRGGRAASGSSSRSTCRRTTGANLRSRSSISIISSRSSASSSSRSVIALRVTRNSEHASISMPGNSRSRLFAITSARSTNVRDVPTPHEPRQCRRRPAP